MTRKANKDRMNSHIDAAARTLSGAGKSGIKSAKTIEEAANAINYINARKKYDKRKKRIADKQKQEQERPQPTKLTIETARNFKLDD